MTRNAQLAAGTRSPAHWVRRGASGTASREKMATNSKPPATLCLIAPGFLAFWGGFPAPVAVFGLFLAGLAIALLYPLSMSFAVGAAGAAGNAASARSGLAAGTAVLTAPLALGALADQFGLSRAYLIAPILAAAILLCFLAARTMERRGAYASNSLP